MTHKKLLQKNLSKILAADSSPVVSHCLIDCFNKGARAGAGIRGSLVSHS